MSEQEQEGDLIIGKDGSEGYLNAEEREQFEEANPELAAYSSLKFKTEPEPEEPSEEAKGLDAAADVVKGARKEARRERSRAEGYELAESVGQYLDRAEEIADYEFDDHEQAEEFRQAAQAQALSSAAAIEDDELRARTFAGLEDRVDPNLFEAVVTGWQEAYSQQTERDMQEGWAQAQADAEKQLKTFRAVVQMEADLLNQLSPLEQACAVKLLEDARDDIAAMDPAGAQEMIRTRMELARDAAAKIEAAAVQEGIIKAHGRTKSGFDGRQLREMNQWALGLLPELTPTTEEIQAAHERAVKGTRIDREKGKRIHKGTGATGMERLEAQTIALSKRLGVPVHDGATGRRLDT